MQTARIPIAALVVLASCLTPAGAEDLTQPIAKNNFVVQEVDGVISVEAEHFVAQQKTDVRAWYRVEESQPLDLTPDPDGPHLRGASGACYLEALPDSRTTHDDKLTRGENFFPEPGQAGVLTYRVHVTNPGRYYVWIRHFSTGTEDNGVHVGLDGTWPESGRRWQTTQKRKWAWECRQRTEKVHVGVPLQLFLDIATAGEHRVHVSMREDGFEFDKLVLTSRRDDVPKGVGPKPVIKAGSAPAAKTLSDEYTEPEVDAKQKDARVVRPPAGRRVELVARARLSGRAVDSSTTRVRRA